MITYYVSTRSQNLDLLLRTVFRGFLPLQRARVEPERSTVYWQYDLSWDGKTALNDLIHLLELNNRIIVNLNRFEILFLLNELRAYRRSIQFFLKPGLRVKRTDSLEAFLDRRKFSYLTPEKLNCKLNLIRSQTEPVITRQLKLF